MSLEDFAHNFSVISESVNIPEGTLKKPSGDKKLKYYREKREQYRSSHNEMITRMNVLAALIPSWCFEPQENETETESSPLLEETVAPLMGADILNFMLETYNFQRERNAKKATEDSRCRILPEGHKDDEKDSYLSEYFASHYEKSSAKSVPFWPLLPINQDVYFD